MTSKELENLLETCNTVLVDLANLSPLASAASLFFPTAIPIISLAIEIDAGLRAMIAEVEPIVKGNITDPYPLVGPDPTKVQ